MNTAVDGTPALDRQAEMVSFTYVDQAGEAHSVQAPVGDSLMKVATENLISGVEGDCGGSCACGTCRIRIEGLDGELGGPGDDERDLLTFIDPDESGVHRLGCQIAVSRGFAGCKIIVAPE